MNLHLKTCSLLFVILVGCMSPAHAPASQLTTNLVEILPHIHQFATALELELADEVIDTNAVTRFRPYLGFGRGCGITIKERWGFQFDVKHAFVMAFTDRERSMNVLWKEKDLKPLMRPSQVNEEGALHIARSYLLRLGFREDDYPVKTPEVHQWKWEPPDATTAIPLPFFRINWEWKHRKGADYFAVEIDGIRQRVVYFDTMHGSFAEEDMERLLRKSKEPGSPQQE